MKNRRGESSPPTVLFTCFIFFGMLQMLQMLHASMVVHFTLHIFHILRIDSFSFTLTSLGSRLTLIFERARSTRQWSFILRARLFLFFHSFPNSSLRSSRVKWSSVQKKELASSFDPSPFRANTHFLLASINPQDHCVLVKCLNVMCN